MKVKKRIPLNKNFMHKSVNDWIYGYFQSKSYVDKNGVTFCYLDSIVQTDIIKSMPFNENGKKPGKMKISNDIKKLMNLGFIEKGKVVDLNDEIIDAYILPFDKQQLYKIIPLDTLIYLLNVSNQNVIRIYIYLLNKFQWKVKNNEYYYFTYKELIEECLGMKSTKNTRDYILIKHILDCLIKFKLIKIDTVVKKINGKTTKTFKLISISQTIELAKELL